MPLDFRPAWYRTLGLTAAALAVALAVGFAIGQVWPALALTALAIVIVQGWKLQRVLQRLDARKYPLPAVSRGVWDELDRLLHRSQSETRSSKRRLLEMLRAYRAAAAALPDAIVVVDRNTQRILWVNEAANPLLGLQYPRDIGAGLAERLQPLPIAQWLSAGRDAEPLQDVASPHQGHTRLLLRLIPYSEELWLLVARDISKMMRLEHMRRDFVANVSHELRTPLTVVHGYLDMLDPEEHPAWAPMLNEMQRQSQRMTQLVEDLLTLSRLEAQETLPEETVGMAGMLATLAREAKVLSQQRHTIVLRDEALVDLWGSTKELHSAFSNLVSNAIRYTPAGGTITVRFAHDDEGGATLAVQDTGYGIPEHHLPRITERFYRVSTSRSRETGGTGLGLSIVKHVLNLHQGRLEIRSEVGRGSVFLCRFGRERLRPREGAGHDDDASRRTPINRGADDNGAHDVARSA